MAAPPPSYSPNSTTSTLSSNFHHHISSAKQRIYSSLSTRRPWRQLFNLHSLSFPSSFSDSISRIKTNLTFFRMNFAIIILVILFLSLIFHPISLIVFVALMLLWLFFFFLRDEPLVVFNRSVDDRIVLGILSVLTLVCLLFTGATGNIIIAVAVGVVVVLVCSIFRRTDDLFLDEEQAAAGGLISS